MSDDNYSPKMMYDLVKETRQDVKEIRREMNNLKIKVGIISGIIGFLSSFLHDLWRMK